MNIEDLICLCIDLRYEVSITYKKDGIHVQYTRHGLGVYMPDTSSRSKKSEVVISYEQWYAWKDDPSCIRKLFIAPIQGALIEYNTFDELASEDKEVKWRSFRGQYNNEGADSYV